LLIRLPIFGIGIGVKVGSTISIGWDELSERERERLYRALSFPTANGDVMTCYRRFPERKIEIPRGAWDHVGQLDYIDSRTKPPAPKLKFTVELDRTDLDPRFEGQSKCVATMLAEEQGIVIRAPGTGKTQIALAFAAQCKTTVLVLVHTKDILDQWVEYAGNALPGTKIGVIQGSKETYGQITIAMVQSLKRFYGDSQWWRQWGAVILDEAHHAAAKSFESVLNACPAFYRFGFTATNSRADGMQPYHVHLLGPVIHKQKFSTPINTTVKPIYTDFRFNYRGRYDWSTLLNRLVTDEGRNKQIAAVVDRECGNGNSVLVLSRRIEQLERISELLESPGEILTADRGRAERKRILAEFREGGIRCVLATQLADEALDVPRCNCVVLVHPGKHDGRITQQIGRAIRKFEGKRHASIYDVVDKRVGVLANQWRERKRTYGKLGLKIQKRKLLRGRA
jgi:superfamily II DNA or RNA helicase